MEVLFRVYQGGQRHICLGCVILAEATSAQSESTSKDRPDQSFGCLGNQVEQGASSPPVPPQDAALQPVVGVGRL